MIARKVEDNPVFQDQVSKRRRMLCSAFAAAACSTGVMAALAKDSPNKAAAAGMAVACSVYLASPAARRKAMATIKPTAQPYGPSHPYQALTTNLLKGVKGMNQVKICKSDHPDMVFSSAFTDRCDIYLGVDFEKALGDEAQMKAVVAHEVGHLQDGNKERFIATICSNLAESAGIVIPGMLLFTPVGLPMAMASLAVAAGAMVTTQYASQYISRRGEHIADIRAMYNLSDKKIVQASILKTFVVGKQILSDHWAKKNEKLLAEGLLPSPPLKLLKEDYDSRFSSHPNPVERRQVMDEAAKFMP